MITAKVILDSVSPYGSRITTMELVYPRFIHCFHEDTEFLSQIANEFPEWRKYDAIVALGAKIAQYNSDGNFIDFTYPLACIKKPYQGKMVSHKRKTFEISVTPEHRMFSLKRTTNNAFYAHTDIAQDWVDNYSAHRRIPQAAYLSDKDRIDMLPEEAKLIAYYVADGHLTKNGTCNFHLKKQRKVDDIKKLMDTLSIEYEHVQYGDEHVIKFNPLFWVLDCYTDGRQKKYPDFMWQLSNESYEAFKEGVLLSDGYLKQKIMNTSSETVANQTQIIAALNGDAMNIRKYGNRMFSQKFQDTNYVSFRADNDKFNYEEYDGNVVCFSVPSTYLFVRFKGFAFVSGNCEFLTHRAFSRNSSSSRAIPVQKMIDMVRENPVMPIHWGKNQPGMQAYEEISDEEKLDAISWWQFAANQACIIAEKLNAQGIHKQIVNRILEPYQHITTLVTATDWDNFFALRDHDAAEPHIRELAQQMRKAMDESTPVEREYHVPYAMDCDPDTMHLVSVARCARVSYKTFDGKTSEVADDIRLANKLLGSKPIHASPAEHQAYAKEGRHANYIGWQSYRNILEESDA